MYIHFQTTPIIEIGANDQVNILYKGFYTRSAAIQWFSHKKKETYTDRLETYCLKKSLIYNDATILVDFKTLFGRISMNQTGLLLINL